MHEGQLADLRLPASEEFIPVAKAVAARLGGMIGFGIEEIDELNIAVVQICLEAIEVANEHWGEEGWMHLAYTATPRGLEVEVEAAGPRRLKVRPRSTSRSAPRLPGPVTEPPVPARGGQAEILLRMFVDDMHSHVDQRSGTLRIRMTKYHLG